jgi:hypothetical protein
LTGGNPLRLRAREIAQERLSRERSLLEAVTPEERVAIEETAYAIGSKVADYLLEEAACCPPLAAALTAGDGPPETTAVEHAR